MSKSKENVVDVLKIIDVYGADAARIFVLSDSPADRDFEWTEQGIEGCWKYINKISNFLMLKSLFGTLIGRPHPASAPGSWILPQHVMISILCCILSGFC